MQFVTKEKLIKVGNNIRKWRTLKGIKQEVLAEELEISKVSISKIETGKTDVPLRRLFDIASALEIDIQMLFEYFGDILLPKGEYKLPK